MRAVALGESRHLPRERKALCRSGPAPPWGEPGETRALVPDALIETHMKEAWCHVMRRVFYEGLTTYQRRE
jgi:hypothetical protein